MTFNQKSNILNRFNSVNWVIYEYFKITIERERLALMNSIAARRVAIISSLLSGMAYKDNERWICNPAMPPDIKPS